MKKKIDLRKVQPTKRYKVKELAETLGVTTRAIYLDIECGNLPFFEMDGVIRVWGKEFIDFTKERRSKYKRKDKKEGTLFCLKCSGFYTPVNQELMIDKSALSFDQQKNGTIILKGICPRCGNYIYQVSNYSKLNDLINKYKITDLGGDKLWN